MFEIKTVEIIEIEDKKAVTAVVKSAQALVELTEWIEIEDGVVTIEELDSNMCMNQQKELDELGIEYTTELARAMQEAAQELVEFGELLGLAERTADESNEFLKSIS